MNYPQGGVGYPPSIVYAVQVVISGPNQGLFVYSPSPGTGNLIISVAATGGTDLYGNVYPGNGLTVFGATGQRLFMGIVGGNTAEIQFQSGAAMEGAAAAILAAAVGAGAAQFVNWNIVGPKSNVVGHRDNVLIELNSANQGGTSFANGEFIYNDDAGAPHLMGYFDATGFNFPVDPLIYPLSTIVNTPVSGTVAETVLGRYVNAFPVNEIRLNSTYNYQLKGLAFVNTAGDTFTFRVRLDSIAGTVVAAFAAIAGGPTGNRAFSIDGSAQFGASGAAINWQMSHHLCSIIAAAGLAARQDVEFAAGTFDNSVVSRDLVITVQISSVNSSCQIPFGTQMRTNH